MSGFSDPFSPPGVPQQPGDFWRNLAMFGAQMSMAANARNGQGFLTYGPGFSGPFGAGVAGAMQGGMDLARQRSALGLQAAQTQDVRSQAASRNIQNKLGLYNLNLTSQLYGGPQFDENGNVLPQGQASPFSVLPQQHFQQQSQQTGGGASGGGGTIASNPDLMPHIEAAAQKWGVPVPLVTAFLQQESSLGTNPKAQDNVGQITFKTANKPGYGMAPLSAEDMRDPAKNVDFAVQYLRKAGDAAGVKDWNDPSQWGVALQAYNGGGDSNYVQNVARWLPQGTQVGPGRFQVAQAGNGPLPVPTGQGQVAADPLVIAQGILTGHLNPTPQQAIAAAPLIGRINPQLGQELMNYGLAGAKAASVKAAEFPYVGPEQAAKSANSNIDLRAGGMARTFDPVTGQQVWVKNPSLEKVQIPGGAEQYVHITPPLPNAPAGTPGEATPVLGPNGQPAVAKIPPDVQAARTKAAEDFAGKDTDSFIAAQNTHSWLEQMNHSADLLNESRGFLNTGPSAPERLRFAAGVNDILRTIGSKEVFDPKAIGAWEELKKATTTAGFELSSHYEGHARQAAQTIINATSAVPSESNSPQGFRLVSSGIQEAAQAAIDLHNFKQDVYSHGGDLVKAEVDYFKSNPAQMYARRAISRVTPYPVTEDKQLSRYLPGTFVQYKGHIVQVPERPGAPPIPEYLQGAAPYQAQQ